MLGEAPMRHMKLPLAKGGSLLRDEVSWIRAVLGRMRRLEVLGQSLDLTQVFQLKWVIVGGKSDVLGRLGLLKLLWCIFPRRVTLMRVWSVVACVLLPL